MKQLKSIFEALGLANVSTYINSGNVFFESSDTRENITNLIEKSLFEMTNTEVKVLVKSKAEIIKIAKCIPSEWENNTVQKTDVAYLFEN